MPKYKIELEAFGRVDRSDFVEAESEAAAWEIARTRALDGEYGDGWSGPDPWDITITSVKEAGVLGAAPGIQELAGRNEPTIKSGQVWCGIVARYYWDERMVRTTLRGATPGETRIVLHEDSLRMGTYEMHIKRVGAGLGYSSFWRPDPDGPSRVLLSQDKPLRTLKVMRSEIKHGHLKRKMP